MCRKAESGGCRRRCVLSESGKMRVLLNRTGSVTILASWCTREAEIGTISAGARHSVERYSGRHLLSDVSKR